MFKSHLDVQQANLRLYYLPMVLDPMSSLAAGVDVASLGQYIQVMKCVCVHGIIAHMQPNGHFKTCFQTRPIMQGPWVLS
jgi:hypothetical protein